MVFHLGDLREGDEALGEKIAGIMPMEEVR
jgi:hypothetical protein